MVNLKYMRYILKKTMWYLKRNIKKIIKPDTMLTYFGNGADLISEKEIPFYEECQIDRKGIGARHILVRRSVKNKNTDVGPGIFFIHKEGDFLGYYIRKKGFNEYFWYACDGNWYTSSELIDKEKRKKLISSEESMDALVRKARGEELQLISQWKNRENGEAMQAGYSIFCHELMAHALGGCRGQRYTNTKEALQKSYDGGYRYFETDVELTEDGKMVLSHGWSKEDCRKTGMQWREEFTHMTWELFKKQTIDGMQVMDIYDLKKFMTEHPDTYFEIDFHRTNTAEKIRILRETFEENEALLDRLLIQAESRNIFLAMKKEYPFKNYQLVLGAEWLKKLEVGISFALGHGIETIAMRYELLDKRTVAILKEAGLNVMAYTLKNDVKRAKELLTMGVDTICTDEISPLDLKIK